jgi:hypothetical protein
MIYRTKFDRTNFCFDPPVRQTADVVFESDAPNDGDHWGTLHEAAWEAVRIQNPHWWSDTKFPIEGYSGWASVMGGHKFEAVIDKDLDYDLGEPGIGCPRIAEIFKKKGWENEKYKMDRDHSWRVTGFYKTWVSPRKDRSKLTKQDREMSEMTDEIMVEILAEERAEMTPSELARKEREIKIIQCSREEAEFVSGAGVAGIILRLEDVEITGRVTWDDRMIARARRDYNPVHDDFPTMWHKYWER